MVGRLVVGESGLDVEMSQIVRDLLATTANGEALIRWSRVRAPRPHFIRALTRLMLDILASADARQLPGLILDTPLMMELSMSEQKCADHVGG